MRYITEVLPYIMKSKKLAEKIQEIANEKAKNGYRLVSCTTTPFPKTIMVFEKVE